MRHHAFATAMGFAAAALLAPGSASHAASVDPTGYWMKPDAERESKIQVFKCGKDKKLLCAKIAWLKEPNDSKGKPLTDVRNENTSLRSRQIVGLAIFTGLTPSEASTWTGKIYNPEDGQTYSATLTVVSRTKILLKGCKAWLLCGERQWYRTAAPEEMMPTPPAEGTQQIEASVTPPLPKPQAVAALEPEQTPKVEQAAAPAPQSEPERETAAAVEPHAAAAGIAPKISVTPVAFVTEDGAASATTTAYHSWHRGYRFLSLASHDTPAGLSNENVSGLFAMANAVETEDDVDAVEGGNDSTAAIHGVDPVPAPKPKAAPKVIAAAAAAPKPAPKPTVTATPAGQAAPAPQEASQTQATAEAATADASMAEEGLTRRQRRLLRRQQEQHEPFLPWLR